VPVSQATDGVNDVGDKLPTGEQEALTLSEIAIDGPAFPRIEFMNNPIVGRLDEVAKSSQVEEPGGVAALVD